MNIQTVTNQPVSDDNDLAKVLSGADGQLPVDEPVQTQPPEPEPEQPPQEPVEIEEVVKPDIATSAEQTNQTPPQPSFGHEDLEQIKKQALEELRPLVDKLDLPPDELFDILLLIIRSTDDEDLIKKAHETAVKIEDQGREAQALLDIIKEVDYFSNK